MGVAIDDHGGAGNELPEGPSRPPPTRAIIAARGRAGEMARAVTVTLLDTLRHEVRIGRHVLIVDEPSEAGGEDAGPSPYELLLASLGS